MLALWATACAAPVAERTPQTTSPTPDNTAADAITTPAPSEVPHALGVFGDLVHAVQKQPDADSAVCMLRRKGAHWSFDGVSEIVMRPLPPAPQDVFSIVMKSQGYTTVFTAAGRMGGSPAGINPLAVTTITPLPVPLGASLTVVVATHSGAFLRTTSRPLADAPLTRDELHKTVTTLPDDAPIVVTANASVPVENVADLLRILGRRTSRLALGVVLPEDTRLPDAATRQNHSALTCPNDLGTAEGSLSVAELRDGLASFVEGAAQCHRTLGTRAQHADSSMLVAIGTSGAVTMACFEQPALPLKLERCLHSRAMSTVFPKPNPTGRVFARIPLRFRATTPRVAPVCM